MSPTSRSLKILLIVFPSFSPHSEETADLKQDSRPHRVPMKMNRAPQGLSHTERNPRQGVDAAHGRTLWPEMGVAHTSPLGRKGEDLWECVSYSLDAILEEMLSIRRGRESARAKEIRDRMNHANTDMTSITGF